MSLKIAGGMDPQFEKQRVAVVHDWLYVFAGAEQVLASILDLLPHADLFCLFDALPQQERGFLNGKHITTSFLQKSPFIKKYHRLHAPLMPLAIEQFNLSGYDLVVSTSHAFAKGVLTGPNQLHISYVHTPMRYAWDLQNQYLNSAGLHKSFRGLFARLLLHYLRLWDMKSACGIDQIITNSHFTSRRISKTYNRHSKVIYPPVDTDYFKPCGAKEDFYLTVSRMVPYKNVDLIAEAFSEMPDRQLVIIGDGPDLSNIKRRANQNIRILGHQQSDVINNYMQRAKAFLFAAEEDFGIVPVEAQACGTPVIAYKRGGCLETVCGLGESKEPTGVFFLQQDKNSIKDAVSKFEANREMISPKSCRENALRFSKSVFKREFSDTLNQAWQEFLSKLQIGLPGDAAETNLRIFNSMAKK